MYCQFIHKSSTSEISEPADRQHEQSSPSPAEKIHGQEVIIEINGGRHVRGILWGSDPLMNLVLDERVRMATSGQQNAPGTVVVTRKQYHPVRSLGTSINNGCSAGKSVSPLHRACLTMTLKSGGVHFHIKLFVK